MAKSNFRGAIWLESTQIDGSCDGQAGMCEMVAKGTQSKAKKLNLKLDYQARVHSGQMVL